MSIMFNQICINEEMLPNYIYIYIYIYIYMYIYIYTKNKWKVDKSSTYNEFYYNILFFIQGRNSSALP